MGIGLAAILDINFRQVCNRSWDLPGHQGGHKTALARELADIHSPNYFDLEDQSSIIALADPKSVLEPLKGLVVIDEVQQRPELFPILRLELKRIAVVYPGNRRYSIHKQVDVVPFDEILGGMKGIFG